MTLIKKLALLLVVIFTVGATVTSVSAETSNGRVRLVDDEDESTGSGPGTNPGGPTNSAGGNNSKHVGLIPGLGDSQSFWLLVIGLETLLVVGLSAHALRHRKRQN
ncbi:hypothetical protein [Lacticaseibacillus brantae]|uniref:Gram-positive cocci surface proteins LPxTG domain-containing protein n=1 Tax=Lacticaseibacillus brantae DSM 23927 TaxID=1423727 RepID=A0A0R2B0C4_9LACO|nr:hypothetical protein [Lacticaseibacillus brantae]KRM72958.1 hypothetical protein FC34_GL000672 [Lacticaseibacillus brantae DSM 23927]